MKHLGDITKISGYEVPVVDCVIGGSPCQDLSVAGKRAGLAGARSGLYMDQIRVIKEMRDNDRNNGRTGVDIRPRYMVWENVPGAFSSNEGQDFAAVLEEAIRIAEPKAPDIHVPEKGWPTAGCYMDEHGSWSVAWRVLDAQFWGTSDKPLPQRRRRIALVADFGGLSAPEILFVRESVSGHTEPGEPKRKGAAGAAESSIGGAVPCTLKIRGGCEGGGKGALIQTDKSATLSTLQDQTLFQPVECYSINHQGGNVEQIIPDKAGTLTAATNSSGNNKLSVDYCYDARGNGDGNVSCTLTGGHQSSISDYTSLVVEPAAVVYGIQGSMIGRADKNGPQGDGVNEDVSFTLNTTDRHAVVYGIGSYHSNAMKSDNPHSGIYEAETARTLDALQCGYPACNQGGMAVVQPICFEPGATSRMGGYCYENIAGTLRAEMGDNQFAVTYQKVTGPLMANSHPGSYTGQDAFSDMLVAGPVHQDPIYTIDRETFNCGQNFAHNLGVSNDGTAPTLKAVGPGGVFAKHIVRRLTPLECERLQGFPDGWTDIGDWVDSKGKKHKAADSPRYKALGNSIALPPWKWVLKRLCACYERDATMASLFDGIGGFPLIWEQLNGKGSCLWASEIEEFPMAVTKLRFGE